MKKSCSVASAFHQKRKKKHAANGPPTAEESPSKLLDEHGGKGAAGCLALSAPATREVHERLAVVLLHRQNVFGDGAERDHGGLPRKIKQMGKKGVGVVLGCLDLRVKKTWHEQRGYKNKHGLKGAQKKRPI